MTKEVQGVQTGAAAEAGATAAEVGATKTVVVIKLVVFVGHGQTRIWQGDLSIVVQNVLVSQQGRDTWQHSSSLDEESQQGRREWQHSSSLDEESLQLDQ